MEKLLLCTLCMYAEGGCCFARQLKQQESAQMLHAQHGCFHSQGIVLYCSCRVKPIGLSFKLVWTAIGGEASDAMASDAMPLTSLERQGWHESSKYTHIFSFDRSGVQNCDSDQEPSLYADDCKLALNP